MEVEDASSNPVTKSIPEAQNNDRTQGKLNSAETNTNIFGIDYFLVEDNTVRATSGVCRLW